MSKPRKDIPQSNTINQTIEREELTMIKIKNLLNTEHPLQETHNPFLRTIWNVLHANRLAKYLHNEQAFIEYCCKQLDSYRTFEDGIYNMLSMSQSPDIDIEELRNYYESENLNHRNRIHEAFVEYLDKDDRIG